MAAEPSEGDIPYSAASSAIAAQKKVPRTKPLVEPKSRAPVKLDQAVTYLPGVGVKNAERLAKLGLNTVRDVLYYYPRDHIDYARQLKIRHAGSREKR